MSSAADVTASEFDKLVLQSDIPVIVDFWAEWCVPCRMFAPVVDAIAEEYAGKLKVYKLNVDKEAQLAAKYNIMTIPTLMLFKGGEVVEQIPGAVSKDKVVEKIAPHLT